MTRICRLDDIPDGGALRAEVGDEVLVLLRFGSEVRAYRNLCSHAGRPLDWAPGKFLLAHGQLVCPAHGASFDPDSGACLGGPCRGSGLTALAIEIRAGEVCLP